MKMPIAVLTLVALSVLAGCHHEIPNRTVCLVDTSRSIDPQGIQYEFGLMDTLVDHMQRGDTLTIIPITGNALIDTPGRVLTFTAPLSREPYDHDLVVMRQKAHERIDAMRTAANKEPANRTDILGALEAVKQELSEYGNGDGIPTGKRTLIVLSDFIEEDGTLNFMSDRRLTSLDAARSLGQTLEKERGFGMNGVRMRLLSIESSDRRRISPQRQRAISEFWKSYFSSTDPKGQVQIVGTGM